MFWKAEDGAIHLTTNDKDEAANSFHVAIVKDGTKPGGHPSLYEKLVKCLEGTGAAMP
jgi:hypothetical protein